MSKNFVFSTASTNITICKYSAHVPNRVPTILKKVIIKGGANVAKGDPRVGLWTPKGIPTELSDEDMAFCLSDPAFQRFVKRKFFTVGTDDRDVDRAAADMQAKDKSAPKIASDFEKKVNVGAPPEAA